MQLRTGHSGLQAFGCGNVGPRCAQHVSLTTRLEAPFADITLPKLSYTLLQHVCRAQPASKTLPSSPSFSHKQPSAAGLANHLLEGTWRLFNVTVSAEEDPGKDEFGVHGALVTAIEKKLGIKRGGNHLAHSSITLVRKSFDSRKKNGKCWKYVVDISGSALIASGVRKITERRGQIERLPSPSSNDGQHDSMAARPTSDLAPPAAPIVVIGSGPAGLFAALEVAEAGLPVVLLERGQPVEIRGRDIGALVVRRKLDTSSNWCYGEGGAGTYSDGKLTTRIGRNDDPVRRVLRILHELGGPEQVLVYGKPHLGTDRLVSILKAFRARLLNLGVDIRFGARVDILDVQNGRIRGVVLADGSNVAASKVVLAVGHSAREMFEHLAEIGVALSPKPFAMGFRIEHPQSVIDKIQYGAQDAETKVLRGKGPIPVAEYRLATTIAGFQHQTPEENNAVSRGAYSFCMCPGGIVVPTSTTPDELCINGMSFSRRDSRWANSALVVTVNHTDWAHHVDLHGPLAGLHLQRDIEREAARLGGGGFVAPAQRVTDFLAGQVSSAPLPASSYRLGTQSAPLHALYSQQMTDVFVKALQKFNSQMPGFISDDAVLLAAETRTSAAVRVERGRDTQSLTVKGLHPCGEGAGYAGGIVSAAVDGMRVGKCIVADLLGRSDAVEQLQEYTVDDKY